MTVCQPGTSELAKSKGNGVISSNKIRKTKNGIRDFLIVEEFPNEFPPTNIRLLFQKLGFRISIFQR